MKGPAALRRPFPDLQKAGALGAAQRRITGFAASSAADRVYRGSNTEVHFDVTSG
jgi:hypothetical protein